MRDKVKVVLDSNYAAKKELDHATDFDTYDLFLVNFPTSLNNLKIKIIDLDVSKLKSVSAVMSQQTFVLMKTS